MFSILDPSRVWKTSEAQHVQNLIRRNSLVQADYRMRRRSGYSDFAPSDRRNVRF